MHVGMETPIRDAEHLLVLPVPFRLTDGQLYVELQAHSGLERWLENFESLIVAAPVLPEGLAVQRNNIAWRAASDLTDRIQFVPLPYGTTIASHVRYYRSTRDVLKQCINHARYLQFAIGGLWGDWAGIAAEEAIRLDRCYAIHMDAVSYDLVLRTAMSSSPFRRAKRQAASFLMRRWHRRLISRAGLALCHGADCYEVYRHWSGQAELVHDFHILNEDRIDPADLEQKRRRVREQPFVEICYAGRMAPEKAPVEWLRAIHRALERGVRIHATWLGDGPLRGEVEDAVDTLGLREVVRLPGFISNRAEVLRAIRSADLMLFTHISPESPRCLIESLRSGTPIVGYTSPYPRDLISMHGGGRLVPMHGHIDLGDCLFALSSDRELLSDLMLRAYKDGEQFSSQAVFKHRSDLIKEHLAAASTARHLMQQA